MPSEPKTPEFTKYEGGSDNEKRCTRELLIRKRLGIPRPPCDGFTLERDQDRADTHRYLKEEAYLSSRHQILPMQEPSAPVKFPKPRYSEHRMSRQS